MTAKNAGSPTGPWCAGNELDEFVCVRQPTAQELRDEVDA
jgi:hypothetical protein